MKYIVFLAGTLLSVALLAIIFTRKVVLIKYDVQLMTLRGSDVLQAKPYGHVQVEVASTFYCWSSMQDAVNAHVTEVGKIYYQDKDGIKLILGSPRPIEIKVSD